MPKKTKRKVSQVRASTAPIEQAAAQPTTESASPARTSSFTRRSIASAPIEFNPDYTYVVSDLKRIGLLAGSFFVVLIILSFIIK